MKGKLLVLIIVIASTAAYGQKLTDTIRLSPVQIIDQTLKKIPYTRNVVLKSELETNAVRDVGEVLRAIPNVSGLRKGGANIDPVIRGFKYSQLMTLINGAISIEGGCPNRMDPTTSHIDIDEIERIEILKGPFALRYGPAFGGVINLITLQPVLSEKFALHIRASSGYETNWNGNREHLDLTAGTRKVNLLVSGNRLQYGDYKDGNGNIVKSSFNKYSYSAKIGWMPAEKHSLNFSYMGTHHDAVRFPALPMDERSDETSILGFSYATYDHQGVFSGAQLKASYSMVSHLMDNKYRSNSDTMVAVSDVDANTLGIRGGVDLNFKDKYFLFIGGDFQYITKDGDRTKVMIMQPPVNNSIPTKIEALWNEAVIQNLGLYGEFKTTLGSFDLAGSVRFDLNDAHSGRIEVAGLSSGGITPVLLAIDDTKSHFNNFSFSAGATKHFGPHFSLGLSAGRGTRSPNMVERFIILLPVGYDNFDYFGNPHLKPEINNEADLTFKFNHEKAGTVEFNVFYSLVQQYITGERIPSSVQKPLSMNVLGVKQFYNADRATFMGFELAYALPQTWKLGARITAAYTYATIAKITQQILDPTKIISQQVIGEITLTNDALAEIPPLEVNLSLYYKFFNGKLLPRFTTRVVFDQSHVSKAFYEPVTPGFILFNPGLSYQFNDLLRLSTGVNNLLNTPYYEHLNRKMIGTTGKLYEPGRVWYATLYFNF